MTLPPELQRSTPRPLVLTAAGRASLALGIFLVLAALVGGAFLHVRAGRDDERAALRAAEALTTQGEILEVKARKGKSSRRWNVTYRFMADSHFVTGHLTDRKQHQVGAPVTVGYLPSDPADNWLAGHEKRAGQYWLAPLALLLGLVSTALIALGFRRQRSLLTYGRAAIARSTKSSRITHQHGGHFEINYEVRLLSGALHRGKLNAGAALAPDSEFILIYDPDNIQHARKYPFSLVRT